LKTWIKRTFSIIGIFITIPLSATDTVLVDVVILEYPVRYVTQDSVGKIWITTGRGWEKQIKGNKFELVNPGETSLGLNLNGTVVPPKDHPKFLQGSLGYQNYSHWKNKIPYYDYSLSEAIDQEGKRWVCNGRNLFIFKIFDHSKIYHSGKSIRGIAVYDQQIYSNANGNIYRNEKEIFESTSFLADGLIFQKDGELYFCDGGLLKIDRNQTETRVLGVSIYLDQDSVTKEGYENFIRCGGFWEDTLWLGTMGGLGYQISNQFFKRIGPEMEIKKGDFLDDHFVVLNHLGELWVRENHKLKKWNIPSAFKIHDFKKANNKIYLASNKGLLIFDSIHSNNWNLLTAKNGLASNILCAIEKENETNLWISSYNGLNWLNLENNQINIVVPKVEFNRFSSTKAPDGKLLFGSVNGIYEIDPVEIVENFKSIKNPKELSLPLISCIILLVMLSGFLTLQNLQKRKLLHEAVLNNQQKEKEIFLLTINQIIQENLSDITIDKLADLMDMNSRTMHRKFNSYGLKPGEQIRTIRVKKIIELTKGGRFKNEEISNLVGYSTKYIVNIQKKYNLN
jgi:ligand-binding sensor domain-containing protein/AraC-like DNA-binding protein